MPVPDFITQLRRKVGHDPLWLPGVGAVVYDDAGRVLLGRRADNGRWTIITGMVDPGEEPARAIAREVQEETGVTVEVEHLVSVGVVGPVTFPNQDVCTFLTLDFRCRYVSGTACVNDDESSDVRWFSLDELPELNARHRALVETARHSDGVPHFVR
jgi:8-oxo-dGTP pyrophosphatase MutT (NUDIX family)